MKPTALVSPLSIYPIRIFKPSSQSHKLNPKLGFSRCSLQSKEIETNSPMSRNEYEPGIFDDLFRNKMVKEAGWDSEKPGYDGLIEVANRLMMKGRTNSETRDAAFPIIEEIIGLVYCVGQAIIFLCSLTKIMVRILRSLFPPFLLELYQLLIAPIGGGKIAAMMVARVTALTCQWLMGTCTVNSVDLPDGTSWESGVFVERCKYLEESKCVGICINTCKLPTQTFFKDSMGVPLLMEPNFTDYSCQFKFGILPPLPEDDAALKEPCLEICPNAIRRKEIVQNRDTAQCPKA